MNEREFNRVRESVCVCVSLSSIKPKRERERDTKTKQYLIRYNNKKLFVLLFHRIFQNFISGVDPSKLSFFWFSNFH